MTATAHAAPDGGGVGDCKGSISDICVIAEVPGHPGSGHHNQDDDDKTPADSADKPVCEATLMDPQPPASSDLWKGHKPGDGAIYMRACLTGPDNAIDIFWAADPPAEAPVDPAVLARQAVDKMTLLGPDIASPQAAGKYTVGVPMWMWVNQSATSYGPNTASASAGAVTVTATAKVSKIVWRMGDGSSVTCNGPGTRYQASQGLNPSPTCGHVYDKTSAGSSGGRYPITATATWTIDWQGGGETGQLTEIRQTNMTVSIGELQVVR
ncbi:ATP/GTP-binding protein [Streptomyces sp. NBC_00687]|uniref:ATP/GTP-binding protein n=1 Tax=Streptomyces sp. NBC_00687 TaxID=2975807 RepID=UPI002253ACC6|nr:ATP/GTP-binding protein [Streptomyces sp. NBC_00687]MCX4911981.1 ATP/GTP-binding protein [Streptomyces sp. NBC_00687]